MSGILKFETSLYLKNPIKEKIRIKVVLKSFKFICFPPKNVQFMQVFRSQWMPFTQYFHHVCGIPSKTN